MPAAGHLRHQELWKHKFLSKQKNLWNCLNKIWSIALQTQTDVEEAPTKQLTVIFKQMGELTQNPHILMKEYKELVVTKSKISLELAMDLLKAFRVMKKLWRYQSSWMGLILWLLILAKILSNIIKVEFITSQTALPLI